MSAQPEGETEDRHLCLAMAVLAQLLEISLWVFQCTGQEQIPRAFSREEMALVAGTLIRWSKTWHSRGRVLQQGKLRVCSETP